MVDKLTPYYSICLYFHRKCHEDTSENFRHQGYSKFNKRFNLDKYHECYETEKFHLFHLKKETNTFNCDEFSSFCIFYDLFKNSTCPCNVIAILWDKMFDDILLTNGSVGLTKNNSALCSDYLYF